MRARDPFGDLYESVATARSLSDAAAILRRLAGVVGAERYLLIEAPQEQPSGRSRVVASDWPRDAIEIVGLAAISRLAIGNADQNGPHKAVNTWLIDTEEVALRLGAGIAADLSGFDFIEFAVGPVSAGISRGAVVLASGESGTIDLHLMPGAAMLCSYLWSKLNTGAPGPAHVDPLSEREGECLFWVSEGKTTDEVALILDVSANTVNRYVLHASQKLSAANRTMAAAIAIRGGLI